MQNKLEKLSLVSSNVISINSILAKNLKGSTAIWSNSKLSKKVNLTAGQHRQQNHPKRSKIKMISLYFGKSP